jgi:uncharacterized protein DUF5781
MPWRETVRKSPGEGVLTADPSQVARASFETARSAMRAAGYAVDARVDVAVDPQLPFMGYTTPTGDGYRIVVSGRSLGSGMLVGLLVHELSHVYRMGSRHPSHDDRIVGGVLSEFAPRVGPQEYKQRILSGLVNNIQDLYADDIAFRVIPRTKSVPTEQLVSFLQDWVNGEPSQTGDSERDAWENAWRMANNARALAQMARHGITDAGGLAESRNQHLLSRISASSREEFPYFFRALKGMADPITPALYAAFLSEHLSHFLRAADGLRAPP